MRRPEFIARQSACPSGLLGRVIASIMARETSRANAFAIELLDPKPADRVLEVGFGHGAAVTRLAEAAAAGFVAGVDPSAEMVRVASRRSRSLISRKRVELKQGRAEELPFADASFDKLISVHTLYFWPDLLAPLREAQRVLRPQGRIVLGYRADSAAARQFPRSVYCFRGEDELSLALGTLGFEDVRTCGHQDGTAVVSMTIATRRP